MKTKLLVGYMLTLCGGLGLGYYIGVRCTEDKAEARILSEVNEMKAYFEAKKAEKETCEVVETENSPVEGIEASPEKIVKGNIEKKVPVRLSEKTEEGQKVAYNLVSKPDPGEIVKKNGIDLDNYGDDDYSEEEEDGDFTIDGLKFDSEEDMFAYLDGKAQSLQNMENTRGESKPFIIDQNDFDNEERHYDKITLTYWCIDSVFSDDKENMIDDPVAILGQFVVDSIETTAAGGVIYVRNHAMGADYEVILVAKSYSGAVLGVTADEAEDIIGNRFADVLTKERVKRRKDTAK